MLDAANRIDRPLHPARRPRHHHLHLGHHRNFQGRDADPRQHGVEHQLLSARLRHAPRADQHFVSSAVARHGAPRGFLHALPRRHSGLLPVHGEPFRNLPRSTSLLVRVRAQSLRKNLRQDRSERPADSPSARSIAGRFRSAAPTNRQFLPDKSPLRPAGNWPTSWSSRKSAKAWEAGSKLSSPEARLWAAN